MSLTIRVDGQGELVIACGNGVALRGLDVTFARREDALWASPWDTPSGSDAGAARGAFSREVGDAAGAVARISVRGAGEVAWISVRTERPVSGLAVADSFEVSGLAAPAFHLAPNANCFVVTHGLGRSGEGAIGGYWPQALAVDADSLPPEAFAPLVVYDDDSALAVAPASQFVTSTLHRVERGFARGLHGSVDAVPAGTIVETVVAAGRDVAEALDRLGDALLERSGKARPAAGRSVLTSRLGWWNAYGGYYTEPIRPLNEARLAESVDRLRAASIPVSYVGLDLWYPYRVIGQALRFAPDRTKYPRGFSDLAKTRSLDFVFHLSALSPDNEYGAAGADAAFYAETARELRRQRGLAAWHDWLRTQQHLTPALRSDPAAAERWFLEMGRALDDAGLQLLLCMQTMGMALASTALPNALGARTAIDYLFGQPEALDTLAALGHGGFRNDAIPLGELRRQNLLVGSVLHSLGLLPFHDLFLTAPHEGLGGADPEIEAALRAFSCGPVGIGDGPGRTDAALVSRLVTRGGALLHPDRAPRPTTASLGREVGVYRTETVAGSERWEYVLAHNASPRTAAFCVPHDRAAAVAWDVLSGRTVPEMAGTLAPGAVAAFELAPLREGIAPIGLAAKFVPAAAGVLADAEARGGWRIHVDAPGERFSFACPEAPRVRAEGGQELAVSGGRGVWAVDVPESVSWLVATRR